MGGPRVSTHHFKRAVGVLVAGALLATPLAAIWAVPNPEMILTTSTRPSWNRFIITASLYIRACSPSLSSVDRLVFSVLANSSKINTSLVFCLTNSLRYGIITIGNKRSHVDFPAAAFWFQQKRLLFVCVFPCFKAGRRARRWLPVRQKSVMGKLMPSRNHHAIVLVPNQNASLLVRVLLRRLPRAGVNPIVICHRSRFPKSSPPYSSFPFSNTLF